MWSCTRAPYPGCTEEDRACLEEVSGLKMGVDFVAHSPERINPGDKVNTIETIVKVVGACDDTTLDVVAKTYDLVVKAGTPRQQHPRGRGFQNH